MEIIVGNSDIPIDIEKTKVRAILTNDKNQILVCEYNGAIMLPGGGVDNNENNIDALRRELSEESGIQYDTKELNPFITCIYYQQDYPIRGTQEIKNRKITTHYYIGKYKQPSVECNLTDKEKSSKFELVLMSFSELKKVLQQSSENPRNEFFIEELKCVLYKYERYQERKVFEL